GEDLAHAAAADRRAELVAVAGLERRRCGERTREPGAPGRRGRARVASWVPQLHRDFAERAKWQFVVVTGRPRQRSYRGIAGHLPTREEWIRRLGPLYGGAVALAHSTPVRWPSVAGDETRSPTWIVALGAPIGVVAYVAAALAKAIGMPPSVAA